MRRQRCRKLVDYDPRYRTKSDVKPLAEDFLRPINDSSAFPQLVARIGEFVEKTICLGLRKPSGIRPIPAIRESGARISLPA